MAASDLLITVPATPSTTGPNAAVPIAAPTLDAGKVFAEGSGVKNGTLDNSIAGADDFGAVLTQLLGAAEKGITEGGVVKVCTPNPSAASTIEVNTNETSVNDFGSVLTPLLGVTESSATITELRAAADYSNEEPIADVLPEQNPSAALLGVGAPWELLTGVAVVEQFPVAQNTSSRKSAALPAADAPLSDIDTALPSSTTEIDTLVAALRAGKVDGQTAQLARAVHALFDRNGLEKTDVPQTQSSERMATNGESAVLANALSVVGGAQQVESAKERLYVRAHVGATAWADELSGKLTWLTERGIQSASLRLSPEHLGPLEIRISVVNDQASVWFGAAHADTRSALEQALPRLRELFAEQGLNLADAGVFREPPREQANGYRASNDLLSESLGGKEQSIAITVLRARGIVDAYA